MKRGSVESRANHLAAVFDQTRHDHHVLCVEGLGHRRRESTRPVTVYKTAEWDRMIAYEPADLTVTAESGMRLSTLNAILAEHDQWIPLWVADDKEDTLGGAVSAGIDGLWMGGYGPFRDRILGLRVVTPGLGAIELGSHVVKNVAGYNVPRIFVGTRGALGVITAVTLKVSPRPPICWSWVWEGALSALMRRAHELRELAWPWAALTLSYQPGSEMRLRAEWHGRRETVRYLVENLGAGGHELPLWTEGPWIDRAVVFKGALPRRAMGELLEWVDEAALIIEWQTGRIFGSASRSEAQRLAIWLGEHQGVFDVVSGPDLGIAMNPILIDAWTRLKKAYDPEGILG